MLDQKKLIKEILVFVPILTIVPLIIGIFYKLGYLVFFDLKFLITSYSYTELALSSYSSILLTLVALFAYKIMNIDSVLRSRNRIIGVTIGVNLSFIIVHYILPFSLNLIDLVLALVFINILLLLNRKKDYYTRLLGVFIILVVCPGINGINKYYEFTDEASNKFILKNDLNEWYLVDKTSNILILVDKKSLISKNYIFKFVELKDVESMESQAWERIRKAG